MRYVVVLYYILFFYPSGQAHQMTRKSCSQVQSMNRDTILISIVMGRKKTNYSDVRLVLIISKFLLNDNRSMILQRYLLGNRCSSLFIHSEIDKLHFYHRDLCIQSRISFFVYEIYFCFSILDPLFSSMLILFIQIIFLFRLYYLIL